MTTFDYTLVAERVLRQAGANSGAALIDANTLGDLMSNKLTDEIENTDKPQGSNNLNFRAFGGLL